MNKDKTILIVVEQNVSKLDWLQTTIFDIL